MSLEPVSVFLPTLLAEIEALERDGNTMVMRGEIMLAKAQALRMHHDGISKVLSDEAPHHDLKPANIARKGKQPGAMSEKWKDYLRRVYLIHEKRAFGRKHVAALTGVEFAPSQLARQFAPYVAAGYLTELGTDAYRLTDEGLAKIGIVTRGSDDLVVLANQALANGRVEAV